jgi:hypothetical protein
VAVVELPVVRFEQKPGRCGAATAQMILFFKNLTGNQVSDQDALWAQIQANTAGARPASPPAHIDATDCPKWSTQQCDKCPGAQAFKCWCTFPPALLTTLTDTMLPMALTTPPTTQDATASVMASVDFVIPAAALVLNGLHWIAVAGYETDGTNAQPIGGRQVSEIYVCDPEVNAANHNVAIDVWMDEWITPVIQCGSFVNSLVVITATGPWAPPPPPAPSAPTNVVIVCRRPTKKLPPKSLRKGKRR